MMTFKINVREIQREDVPLLMNYWLSADHDYLESLGVDLEKLPILYGLEKNLLQQIETPYDQKKSLALIWELDGQQVGHTNVNNIIFGKQANMHLHLWQPINRRKGLGTELVKRSLAYFFDLLELETLYCEPYALNPAPNKTLPKVGFVWVKKYKTIPGSINFEQEVNQYKMTKEQFLKIK